jgi:hypothetical protein
LTPTHTSHFVWDCDSFSLGHNMSHVFFLMKLSMQVYPRMHISFSYLGEITSPTFGCNTHHNYKSQFVMIIKIFIKILINYFAIPLTLSIHEYWCSITYSTHNHEHFVVRLTFALLINTHFCSFFFPKTLLYSRTPHLL